MRSLHRLSLEAAWALLALANLISTRFVCEWESVPFQLSWAAVTLLYLARSRGSAFLVVMSLITAGELAWASMNEEPGEGRLTELPLIVALFVAVVWIAARRQARADALRRRVQQQREFLLDASHQLRTPITIARGHAELLRAAAPTMEIADDADVLVDELDRLSRLSDRLLLLAAVETPGFLSLGAVELRPFLAETARRWGAAAERRWIVDVEVEGPLLADRERIEAALDALIENALKFTKPGDAIRLSGRSDGVCAVLEVADTGEGIAEADLARIFERFVRGGATRRAGTGLGLSIVRAIVDAHGGSVTVSSTVGSGTCFRLALPRLASNPAVAPG